MLKLSVLPATTYKHPEKQTFKPSGETAKKNKNKIQLLIMFLEMADYVCLASLNSDTYSLSNRNSHVIFKQTLMMRET